MTVYLDLAELMVVATKVNGGTPAIRDMGLLESAAQRPRTTVFGVDAYSTIFDKAAALLHSLARNHALADGNERTAFLAASLMLTLNGLTLAARPSEQEDMMNRVACGESDIADIALNLEKWSTER